MRSRRALWIAAIASFFLFRLAFGLSLPFFGEDETQIFLIGLRHYATGAWPYFGPDIVWTRSVIPGALQGILVGVPLNVWPAPEASYVVLNILSTTALCALCWYISRRLPSIPRWLLWGWVMTLPWTLRYSTHIVNPSYVLPAAVAFFIGFFESVPVLRRGAIPEWLALAMMGGAIVWIAQVHMSYALLPPYAVVAVIAASRHGRLGRNIAAFTAGALVPASLLIPTWLRYGLGGNMGGTFRNLQVHPISPWIAITVLARFFSFASLEINRFVATDNAKRLVFAERHLWLAAIGIPVWAAGLVQPIWMAREWFRTAVVPEWRTLKALVAGTVVWIYASYWLVMEPSQAHAFYVVTPLAIIFAAYCWTIVDRPRLRRAAAAVLALNVVFQTGLVLAQRELSLYHDRAVAAAAVRLKEPELLGHRRPFAIDGGPVALQDRSRPYDPTRDLHPDAVACAARPDGVLMWTFTLRNLNPRVAFRDVLYVARYNHSNRAGLDERHEFVRQVFQPGEARRLEVNDGFADGASCNGASLRIAAAEALLPLDEQRQ